MGLLPDGDPPSDPPEHHPAGPDRKSSLDKALATEMSFTVWQAMRTPAYWMFVVATIARVAAYNSITVHFIPIMVWKGVSEQRGAALLAAMALMSLPSHLLVGWIADFVNKPKLMAISMAVGLVALFCLAVGEAEWTLWLFTLLFTFVEAIFPVSWATIGDFYGRKYFGTIRGSMSFFYLWGAAIGPVGAGMIYDRYQSYAPMMSILMALFLLATCLYFLLVRPQPPRSANAGRPGS